MILVAPLRRCAVAPLRRCAVAPLRRCACHLLGHKPARWTHPSRRMVTVVVCARCRQEMT